MQSLLEADGGSGAMTDTAGLPGTSDSALCYPYAIAGYVHLDGEALVVGVSDEVDVLAWLYGASSGLVDGPVVCGSSGFEFRDSCHGGCKVSSGFLKVSAGVYRKTNSRRFHV